MSFDIPTPIFAADFWMTLWLTPIWFLAVGIVAGFAILFGFLGLFKVLSQVGMLEKLRRDGSANVIAAAITLVLGGLLAAYLRVGGGSVLFRSPSGSFESEEWAMFCLATTMMIGIVVWAVLFCSSSRFLSELRSLLFEGVGLYMVATLSTMAAIGLASTFLVSNPVGALRSIPELFTSQNVDRKFDAPPIGSDGVAPFQKIDLQYSPDNLSFIQLKSDRRLLLTDGPSIRESKEKTLTIEANQPIIWTAKMGAKDSPLPMSDESQIYIQNQEVDKAVFEVVLASAPKVRESLTFVLVALFVVVFGLLFMLMQAVAPKAAAIALSAAKSELSQPLPTILMLLVALTILLFVFLPFHTLGEDIKLLKDCGVTLILLAATFQAVWSASTSVNDEIEGRTALTLLSKPVHRRSFIIGKIMGITWIVMLMFLVLGSAELLAVAYKPMVEARESSLDAPTWQQCHNEVMQTIPGLAMAFFQASVLGAFAVALGTRFSLIANFSICFSIYLLGHLTPTIVDSAADGLPLVEFFSQLISAVVPNLSHFSMEAAIDAEVSIPWTVLASILVYTTIYGIAATLMGLLLFEDRDLA
jgi:hypothetical protein